MKKLPNEMKSLVNVILRSRDINIALREARKIKGISLDSAKWIRDTYGGSLNEAFKGLYKDVRAGKYVLESEMKFIEKIVKEELIKEYEPSPINHEYSGNENDLKDVTGMIYDVLMGNTGYPPHYLRQTWDSWVEEENGEIEFVFGEPEKRVKIKITVEDN